LCKKIEEMVKSKEVCMNKALQSKKKNAINQARWDAIRENDKRKAIMEERRLALEERNAMELIADENRTMMMDPSTMDAFTR
jgi:hypothetical protein